MNNFLDNKQKILTIFCLVMATIFIFLAIVGESFISFIVGFGFLYPLINVYVYRFKHRKDPVPEKKVYSYLVNENVNNNIIIDIEQTKQNFGIEYEVKEDNTLIFKGYDNFVEKHLPAKMEDSTGNLIFRYNQGIKELAKAQIPESGHNERKGFIKNQNNDILGKIYHVGFGQDRYYCIDFNSDKLEIYMWSTGRNPHLSVFLNYNQIAQIEHENMVNNYLDKYTLYLLSGYEKYKEVLCFFSMIYDKYENGNHGKSFYGGKTNVSFNYSLEGIGRDKYFEEFMKYNFPKVEIVNEELTMDAINTNLKDGFETNKKQNWTKEKYKSFVKISLPICIIIILIPTILISIFVNLFLGIFIFIFLVAIETLFYWIIKKLCKY